MVITEERQEGRCRRCGRIQVRRERSSAASELQVSVNQSDGGELPAGSFDPAGRENIWAERHVHTLGSFSHISSSLTPSLMTSEGFCSYQLPSMNEPDEGNVHRFQGNKGGGGGIQEKRGSGFVLVPEDGRNYG